MSLGRAMSERKSYIDGQGAILLIGFSLLLGFNQVVIKVSNGGFQPVFQAGVRSSLALVFLALWMWWRAIPLMPRSTNFLPGLLVGLLFSFEFICLFIALDYTSIARSSIMFYSMPVWLAIAAHFVLPNERLTALRSLGLFLAMVGMIWSLGSGLLIEGGSITGDLLALLSAFGWGAIALTVRLSSLSRERAETQLFIQLLISAPVLLIASLWFGDWLREPTVISYAALLFQALVIAFFAFLLWFWIMTIYPASGVASFSFLSPIFSVTLGWLILGEEVGFNLVGALACVALGLVLINRK